MVVDRQPDLLQVVGTLHPGSGLPNLLHGWQEQADQDGNDGDHHQQLDQREASTAPKWDSHDTPPNYREKEQKMNRAQRKGRLLLP
jgi:hypothetical protein